MSLAYVRRIATLAIAVCFAPICLSVVSPASAVEPDLEVVLTSDGLRVSDGDMIVPLTLNEEASDGTYQEFSATTTAGEPLVGVVYLEPQLPEVTAPTENYTRGPGDVESSDPTQLTPDTEEIIHYDPEAYSPTDQMTPVFSEVATPTEVTIAINLELISPPIKGGGSTDPVNPTLTEADTDVYRDGVFMENIGTGSSFTDEHPTAGVTHEYTLVTDVGDAELSRAVAASSFAELSGSAPTATNSRMWLDYRTFIPDARIGSPFACLNPSGSYFNGNNRSWKYPASGVNYKTKTLVKIDWPNQSIGLTRNVGKTILYKSKTSSTVLKSGTASSKNVFLHQPKIGSKSATFTLKHSVGNPLCWSAGPIWYQYTTTAWKNGSMSIYGYRTRAPHHEMYVAGTNGSWNTAARRPLKSFICLNFGCGTDSWTKYYTKSVL